MCISHASIRKTFMNCVLGVIGYACLCWFLFSERVYSLQWFTRLLSSKRKSCVPKWCFDFFYEVKFVLRISFVLSKQSIWTHKLRKGLKIVVKKKWLDWMASVYKGRDMSFVAYHPSSKQIVNHMGREQSTATWIAKWLRAWLSSSYCQVASWVLKQSTYATTFRRFSKADEIGMQRIQKEVPFNRLASA